MIPLQVSFFLPKERRGIMAALQTPWYEKTVEALQLNGKGERTQQAYARAVRMLIEFHAKAAARSTRSFSPAATATVRSVSTTKAKPGWKNRFSASCPGTISW